VANVKTNAMRLLDKAKIEYKVHTYENKDGQIDGISVAQKIGAPVEKVYKTLVTQGHSKEYYVFVIPVADELDLKAAAKSVGDKSVEMIKVADINKITGYIRGGCSPVGMKKQYRTVLDNSCLILDTMIVSAGKIGFQIEIKPEDLIKLINGKTENIIMK
jgi:Cys-tRNA(Pro)/Cys-tRNA(Cys) deacylase